MFSPFSRPFFCHLRSSPERRPCGMLRKLQRELPPGSTQSTIQARSALTRTPPQGLPIQRVMAGGFSPQIVLSHVNGDEFVVDGGRSDSSY